MRYFLEVMPEEDDAELREPGRNVIPVELDSPAKHGAVSVEEVLAGLGLTMADLEA